MGAKLSPLLSQATNVLAVRGQGCRLYDEAGRGYLDFTSGIGVTSTGHCHPHVVAAAQAQTADLIHGQFTTVMHPRLLELTERLGDVLPDQLDSVFYANAGTEAVEAAVRLARQATRRTNIIVFQGSFHGRTTASLAMTTSKTSYRAGLQPLMSGVFVAPFPYSYRYGWKAEETTAFCLKELDYLLATQSAPEETAAIVIEPVLGEGGYVPAPPGFLEGIAERCRMHGIVFVIDEVQTGFGRTGEFWAFEHGAARPDVIVMAKGIASGFPLSAIAASEELMSRGWPGSQGGTYGGNAVAAAAAIATLDVIRDEALVGNAHDMGTLLLTALRRLQASHPAIGDVRGLGLMAATEFVTDSGEPDGLTAKGVTAAAERNGLLLLTCGPHGNVVRWIPPLIVTEEEIDEGLVAFEAALAESTG
ncbi:MAG TPA: aminotransferase class III-fold pyridoxal phosphate-dependent enzyme [Acidimicrobiia bacterium]